MPLRLPQTSATTALLPLALPYVADLHSHHRCRVHCRMLAYVVMLIGSFIFFSQTGHLYATAGHFVSAMLAASM